MNPAEKPGSVHRRRRGEINNAESSFVPSGWTRGCRAMIWTMLGNLRKSSCSQFTIVTLSNCDMELSTISSVSVLKNLTRPRDKDKMLGFNIPQ